MRPPAPPIDLTSETTHVGGSFEHIGNKKIQTCYSVTPDFFHGISVKDSKGDGLETTLSVKLTEL